MAEDLSVEQAVSLLATPETAAEETQQDIQASSTEAEPVSEEETPGDDETVEPETEAAAEPVEAPTWWTPEDKEKFAELPPELQAAVVKNEGTRETLSQRARQEAAEAKKLSDQRVKELTEVVQKANEVLPKAQQTFQSRWENVDWQAFANGVEDGTYTAEQYTVARARYDADLMTLQQAMAQAERAGREQAKLAAETFEAELASLVPALCEPTKGPANRQELTAYMVKNGIPKEVVNDLAAAPVGLFWKAMQFDKAQEALKSRPKTPVIPQKGNTVPTATPQRTSQQRSVEQINARFQKSGSVDDGVALLMAKGF